MALSLTIKTEEKMCQNERTFLKLEKMYTSAPTERGFKN